MPAGPGMTVWILMSLHLALDAVLHSGVGWGAWVDAACDAPCCCAELLLYCCFTVDLLCLAAARCAPGETKVALSRAREEAMALRVYGAAAGTPAGTSVGRGKAGGVGMTPGGRPPTHGSSLLASYSGGIGEVSC